MNPLWQHDLNLFSEKYRIHTWVDAPAAPEQLRCGEAIRDLIGPVHEWAQYLANLNARLPGHWILQTLPNGLRVVARVDPVLYGPIPILGRRKSAFKNVEVGQVLEVQCLDRFAVDMLTGELEYRGATFAVDGWDGPVCRLRCRHNPFSVGSRASHRPGGTRRSRSKGTAESP